MVQLLCSRLHWALSLGSTPQINPAPAAKHYKLCQPLLLNDLEAELFEYEVVYINDWIKALILVYPNNF